MRHTTATALLAATTLVLSVPALAAAGSAPPSSSVGLPGVGDDYFPLDGNGGYGVGHYDLALRYDPASGRLSGLATIRARARQDLTRFDLDLVGLQVQALSVDGRRAGWTRDGQELVVTPRRPLAAHHRFVVRVRYAGVPQRLEGAGFIATDDGMDIAGQPHVAASWFPVNDHPSDRASYRFRITAPRDRQVVANGDLVRTEDHGRWTTWTWRQPQAMASYLATVDVGRFRTRDYHQDGIRFHDAVDPDLYAPVAEPSTGTHLAISGQANSSFKRLTHVSTFPPGDRPWASPSPGTPRRTGTSPSSRPTRWVRTTGRRWRT